MAFVVEDGTGLTTATSLMSVADADTYWADRASSVWAAYTTAAKQAALVQASEYLSTAVTWRGEKSKADQGLAWPRVVYTDEGESLTALSTDPVPKEVKNATARIAFLVAGGSDFFASVDGNSAVKRIKAGSVELEFMDQAISASMDGRPTLPWLVQLLSPWTLSGGTSSAFRKVRRV